MQRIKRWLLGIMVCGFMPGFITVAEAEQAKSQGDYTVHYSAFTTDTLPQSVARSYQIQRSQSRALVNISVLKKVMGTTGQPVAAEISGTATNLNAQLRQLGFRELGEAGARYYIAEFPVKNDEVMNFSINVTPEGSDETISLEFQQHFYTQ